MLREYRDYSQQYMAARLGILQNAYSKIENGKTSLKPARLQQIAQILGVTVQDITEKEMQLVAVGISDQQQTYMMTLLQGLVAEVKNLNRILTSNEASN